MVYGLKKVKQFHIVTKPETRARPQVSDSLKLNIIGIPIPYDTIWEQVSI